MEFAERVRTKLEKDTVSDRKSVSLYLSESLLAEAKNRHPDAPISRLVEALLRGYLELEEVVL